MEEGQEQTPIIILECGKAIKRNLAMHATGCDDDDDNCHREYKVYFPTSLCSSHNNGTSSTTRGININNDILPILFAVHCLGGTTSQMEYYTKYAELYNMVLVLPQGLRRSWNAKYCCGYALRNQVDDVEFFRRILNELDNGYSFVNKDIAYATGHSNGGFMVMYAARLFRAIAPVAGYYQYETNLRKSLFASQGGGVGLFLHHSQNDPAVRFTGCCTDLSKPKCCCGISQKNSRQCVSATDIVDSWAKQINNNCSESTSNSTTTTTKTSFVDEDRGITCRTITAGAGGFSSCRSSNSNKNTTICVHESSGHFTRPNFREGFNMSNEVADFFARDACTNTIINNNNNNNGGGGSWSSGRRKCTCSSTTGYGGTYCLVQTDSTTSTSISSPSHQQQHPHQQHGYYVLRFLVFVILICSVVAFLMRWRQNKRKYKGWQLVSTSMESKPAALEMSATTASSSHAE